MKKTSLLLILIIFLIFISAGFVLAQFAGQGLEVNYPEVGLTLTKETGLPGLIKYIFNISLLVAGVAAFIALIAAGFKYLTSSGKPEAMADARKGIFAAFLGLVILLASYLILQTVNPQLIIMRLEKVPVPSAVILATAEGLNGNSTEGIIGLTSDPSLENLEKLIKSGRIYYLNSSITDSQEQFQELFGGFAAVGWQGSSDTAVKVNFEKFGGLQAIGFVEEQGKKVKIIAYQEKDFKKEGAVEYTFEGKLNNDGSVGTAAGSYGEIKLIDISSDFFSSEVNFVNSKKIDATTGKPESEEKVVLHPALSFEVKLIRPGIYLYSDKTGEEIDSRADIEDLLSEKFNDKAKKIEIKNKVDWEDEEHDYIAVLHEDTHWAGKMRIFFQQKERGGQTVGNVLISTDLTFPRRINVDAVDQYGKVEKPSSMSVQELSGDPSVCQEVWLCTGKYYQGNCLVYFPTAILYKFPQLLKDVQGKDTWLADGGSVPIYLPKNILVKAMASKLKEDGTEEPQKEVVFAKEIKSIKIVTSGEGGCLVTLFEKSVPVMSITSSPDPDYQKCITGLDTTKCWDTGSPGSKSELFMESDPDLTDNEIHHCGFTKGIGFFEGKSCASAIAIYPIKSKE